MTVKLNILNTNTQSSSSLDCMNYVFLYEHDEVLNIDFLFSISRSCLPLLDPKIPHQSFLIRTDGPRKTLRGRENHARLFLSLNQLSPLNL